MLNNLQFNDLLRSVRECKQSLTDFKAHLNTLKKTESKIQKRDLSPTFREHSFKHLLHLPEKDRDEINLEDQYSIIEREAAKFDGLFTILDKLFKFKYENQEGPIDIDDDELENHLTAFRQYPEIAAIIDQFVRIETSKVPIYQGELPTLKISFDERSVQATVVDDNEFDHIVQANAQDDFAENAGTKNADETELGDDFGALFEEIASENSHEVQASDLEDDEIGDLTEEESDFGRNFLVDPTAFNNSKPAHADLETTPPTLFDDLADDNEEAPVVTNEEETPVVTNEEETPVVTNEEETPVITNEEGTSQVPDEDGTITLAELEDIQQEIETWDDRSATDDQRLTVDALSDILKLLKGKVA